jgi:hypothetical protein
MNPRGKPFEPGNKMGRGRPKGSRNKSKAAVQQLLEQSEVPLVAQCLRQALNGHLGSQRMIFGLLQKRPNRSRRRLGKLQSFEDLRNVAEDTMRQLDRGTITPEEVKVTTQMLQQMGQLLEQCAQEKISQRPPKQIMPDFLLEFIQREKDEHEKLLAQERAEKAALARDAANPLENE